MKRHSFMIGLCGAAATGVPSTAVGHRPPDQRELSKRALFSTYVTNVDTVLGHRPFPVVPPDPVRLRRVPDRSYDPHSIAVETTGGVRLGYVPTNIGRVLAPMLKAGLDLKAHVIGARNAPRRAIEIEIAIAMEAAVQYRET